MAAAGEGGSWGRGYKGRRAYKVVPLGKFVYKNGTLC